MFGPSAAMAMSAARMTSFRRNYTPPSTTRDLVATEAHVTVAQLVEHFNNLTTAMMQRDERPQAHGLFTQFRVRIRIRVTGL